MDTFCLVTSDSEFAYLCPELRERGATVHIVVETKTPPALRNARDHFFEWNKPAAVEPEGDAPSTAAQAEAFKAEVSKPAVKRRPKLIVEAVRLMASITSEAKVHLGGLGQYLKRTDPAFSP